jgi:rubrerythrin
MDSNNIMNTRDCLQRAWNNTMELVRDFEMYSKSIEDKEVADKFKKFAEEQGYQASKLRELFNEYDNRLKS